MRSAEFKYSSTGKFSSYFIFIIGLFILLPLYAAESPEAPGISSGLDSVNTSDPQPSDSSKTPNPEINDRSLSPQISKPSVLPDNDNAVRLLQLTVDQYSFDDLIVAYQYEDMLFVPFGAFSELIDLAIKANPTTGIAEGFIFDEKKTFLLDVNRGEVTISGVLSQFDNKRTALRVLDDIYVDSELLAKWLPLKVEIDLYASRIKIKPDRPLPFQLKMQREKRVKTTLGRLVPIDRGYPRYTAPYEDWSYPHINFTARAGVYKNNVDETGSTYSHATYAAADLFNMESAWYVSGHQDEFFDDFRVTFGKKDIDADLLGPMKASEYAFGHINEPRIDLINRSISIEPGIVVSNYPLTRQQQYDSHTFSGDLPPGWEVELYRNNSLLNYISESIGGRYQFDDVPLLYGHNHFRLVFYGPQGQVREETHTFELGQSLTIPGEHHYRVFVSSDEDFGNRAILQYDAGINKHLSASASLVRLPIDKDQLIYETEGYHQYLTAGLKGFQKYLFYKVNYTKDTAGGSAADWGMQSRLGPVILNLSEIYFNDFISEEFNETLTLIKQRRSLKLDTAIPTAFLTRLPISFEYQQDTFDDGSTNKRLLNRISAQKHGYAITNNLTLQSVNSQEDMLSGSLQGSRRAKEYNLRASLGYLLKPDRELDSVSITADGFKLWGFNASAGISKVISADNEQFTFGLNRQLNGYSLGVSTRVTSDGIYSLDLLFNTSLAREPRTGKWFREARPIASQGAISAQVFLDENGDGKKDAEEDVLPGVKININGGATKNRTDEDGISFHTGLLTYQEMDVDIALDSLEDPLLQPSKSGLRVDLRPGHVTQLDFPVMQTGEVDGTTFVQYGDVVREASGVHIELIDSDGKVVKSVRSAYDGFFVIDRIPVGFYKLRVSEQQIKDLGLLPVEERIIEITSKTPIINGQDFLLKKDE